jgi:hypothetical protein
MKKLIRGLRKVFSRQGQGGYVLTWVLILSVVAGFVLAPFLSFMLTGVTASYSYADTMSEFYAADSGIEDGIYKISTNYSVSTTLSDDLEDDATVIEVVSTADFPERGVIKIDSEYIKYSSKNETQFIVDIAAGGERGYDVPVNGDDDITGDNDDYETDPADHNEGAVVTASLPDSIEVGEAWEYGIEDINGKLIDISIETVWTLWGLGYDDRGTHPHNDMAVVGQMQSTVSTRLLADIEDDDDLNGETSDIIEVSSTLSFPDAIDTDSSVIRIDNELFQYTGTAFNDNGTPGDESDDYYEFTGVTRGYNNTEWAEHLTDTAVTSEEKTYEITAVWSDAEMSAIPKIDTLGCWLPPGFDYVPGTSNVGSELTDIISDSTDDIEVDDVSMFAIDADVGYGVVCIEHELIRYEAVSGGQSEIQDCTRGYNGTLAVGHASGTPITAEPNQKSHHGGTALTWPVDGDFEDLPREAPMMEGAEMPDEYPLSRMITFSFTPAGQPNGAFSWIVFQPNSIAVAWDTSGGTYKVTATAADAVSGTHTDLESYVGAKELTDRNAIVQGDARVIGNSLMLDQMPDSAHIKDTIIDESSASIGEDYDNAIPDGANIEAAYLYWSAWKKEPDDISGEDLDDLADEVNHGVFTVADGEPQYITADTTQILQDYIYTYGWGGSVSWDTYGWVFSCFKDVTDLLNVNRDTYTEITIQPTTGSRESVEVYREWGNARVRIRAESPPNPDDMELDRNPWIVEEDGTQTGNIYISDWNEPLVLTSGVTPGTYEARIRRTGGTLHVIGGGVDEIINNSNRNVYPVLTTTTGAPGQSTLTKISENSATVGITLTGTLPSGGYVELYHDYGGAGQTLIDTLDADNLSIEREMSFATPDTLVCGTTDNYDITITCSSGIVQIDNGSDSYIIGESSSQTNGEYTFGLDPANPFVVDSYGGGGGGPPGPGGGDTGDTGEAGSYAGWGMIVIYSHPDEDSHQLFLYDNIVVLSNYADNIRDEDDNIIGYLEATISGFVAPEDFDGYLTYFVGEGDSQYGAHQYYISGTGRGYEDDEEYVSLNGVYLYDDESPIINPEWNIMNSQSSVPGITGDTDIGVDIDTYNLAGILEQGDSAATLKMDTGVDGWVLVFMFLSFKTEPTTDTGTTPIAVNTFSFGGQ